MLSSARRKRRPATPMIFSNCSSSAALTDHFSESSPAFMAGGFEILQAMWRDEPKIEAAFQSGEGVGWHEHDACLFRGTERFFRPGYNAHLVGEWLPALEGVTGKLAAGAKVAGSR